MTSLSKLSDIDIATLQKSLKQSPIFTFKDGTKVDLREVCFVTKLNTHLNVAGYTLILKSGYTHGVRHACDCEIEDDYDAFVAAWEKIISQ